MQLDLIIGLTIALLTLVLAFRSTQSVLARNPGLRDSHSLLTASLAVWVIATIHRAAIWIPSLGGVGGYDGTYHETLAREVAEQLVQGDISIFELTWLSNEGYKNMLGVFYALTGAPNFAAVAIHALMAYCGLLFILEAVALTICNNRVPRWLVAYTMLLPSALIFTPWILKEAPGFWGIGILMRASVAPQIFFARPMSMLFTAVGAMAVFTMRPHIGGAWILAAAIGHFSPSKRPIATIAVAIMVLLSYGVTLAAIDLITPGFSQKVSEQGIVDVLDKSTDQAQGGSAIVRESTPIPFLNGLIFILVEPNPTYWLNPNYAIVGIEAWFITIMILYQWYQSPNKIQLLTSAQGLMCVVALLAIAFYLGYMYNMGLMVRQRLQVMPALILLAALPLRVQSVQGDDRTSWGSGRGVASVYKKPGVRGRVSGIGKYEGEW